MQKLESLDPWSRKTSLPATRIATCQRRLALSVSPGADLLLELLSGSNLADNSNNDSLWEHAATIRQANGFDGAGQTIAVIDSGIAYDHVALGSGFGPGYRVVGGWDFAEQDSDPYDDGPAGFHGTHVAGILAGNFENFAGIAPEADLAAMRVFDDNGIGNLNWVEQSLQWVIQHRNDFASPITTVNLSLGALLPENLSASVQSQLADEFSALKNAGVLVFASAGNSFDSGNPTQLAFPASSPDVEAVGSINDYGELSFFSQRAPGILVAPGERISSSVPDHVLGWDGHIDDFSRASGTSMSSPQVAAASVLLREAAMERGLNWSGDDVLQRMRSTADVRYDVTTGINYLELNLDRAFAELLADHSNETIPIQGDVDNMDENDLNVTRSIHEIGVVSVQEVRFDSSSDFQLSAGKSGILSLVVNDVSASSTNAVLSIFDVSDKVLWQGNVSNSQQIDFEVVSGQSLRIRLEGTDHVSATVVNLVRLSGGELDVSGTVEQDTVKLELGNTIKLEVDAAKYSFSQSSVQKTAIDLGPSRDALTIVGSSGSDKLTLRPDSGEMTGALTVTNFVNIESVSIAGGGGEDRAYLYDSPQADELEMSPGMAKLSGVGYSQSLTGFARLFVDATSGGEDRANLFDSPGDDRLAIRNQFTSLSGDDYFLSAIGFERVSAYGGSGGDDQATLYDSPGDDRMSANSAQAWISGPNYYAQAYDFNSVHAFSAQGGHDHATIYAGAATDQWVRAADLMQLETADGRLRSASGFELNESFLGGKSIQIASFSLSTQSLLAETSEIQNAAESRVVELLNFCKPNETKQMDTFSFDPRLSERQALNQVFSDATTTQPQVPLALINRHLKTR